MGGVGAISTVEHTELPKNEHCRADSPVPLGKDWVKYVNQRQTKGELEAIRRSVKRGQPFGSEAWQQQVADRMGLEHTFRPRGRPRKSEDAP